METGVYWWYLSCPPS